MSEEAGIALCGSSPDAVSDESLGRHCGAVETNRRVLVSRLLFFSSSVALTLVFGWVLFHVDHGRGRLQLQGSSLRQQKYILHGNHGESGSSREAFHWPVMAETSKNSAWERYRIKSMQGGRVAFQTIHGTYLTATSDGTLLAYSQTVGCLQSFGITRTASGDMILNSAFGFVRASPYGSVRVDLREQPWTVENNTDGTVSLKSVFGKYLTAGKVAIQRQNISVTANRFADGLNLFILEESRSATFLKSTVHGTYISVQPDGSVTANAPVPGPCETFNKIAYPDGSLAFLACNGLHITAYPDGWFAADSEDVLSPQLFRATPAPFPASCAFFLRTAYDAYMAAVEVSLSAYTCETRLPRTSWSLQGSPGLRVENLGLGRRWLGYRSKISAYLEKVRERAEAARPGEIMVLADGGDMAWGGCTHEQLLARYHAVVVASKGATVVVGAENCIWPDGAPTNRSIATGRRSDILRAFRLTKDELGTRPRGSSGDSGHRRVKMLDRALHPNSGFLMGPPVELMQVLSCVKEHGIVPEKGELDDQYGLAMCTFFVMPERITMDYTGSIVLNLVQMSPDILSQESSKGVVRNEVIGAAQCFVHGNGRSLPGYWERIWPRRRPNIWNITFHTDPYR